MNRIFTIVFALLYSVISFAQGTTDTIPTRDDNMAMGNPSNALAIPADSNNYLLVRSQYTLSYNNAKGIANWVSWHLSAAWKGSATRCDCFTQDGALPPGYFKASTANYTSTGFDRGHLCPSDDRDGSDSDNAATFKMTNICPQSPILNQQTWENLESYCRTLMTMGNELYIIAGGYGTGGTGSLGGTTSLIAGRITVPSRFWKVIVVLPVGINDATRVTAATRVIAVDMPNVQSVNAHPWEYYRVSVDSIEARTGYDLLSSIDTAIQRIIEARVDSFRTSMIAWNSYGLNGAATMPPASVTIGLDTAAGLSTMARGGGAPASSGANSFRTTGFGNNGISLGNTDYFQFKVKAATGYDLSLSGIDARFAGTASFCAAPGVSGQFAYSLDGTTFTLIGSPAVTVGTPAVITTIDLSGIPALQHVGSAIAVWFRYYASGQTTTGGWGLFSSSATNDALSISGALAPAGCSGTPSAGVAAATDSICSGVSSALTLSGASRGTGISYQWQSSTSAATGFTNIAGATDTAYTVGPLSGSTYFHCTTTCTNSGLSSTSNTTLTAVTAVNAGTITGSSIVTAGSVITLSDSVAGGTWSAGNSNASVNSFGVVTGVTTGTVTITYTVTNSCGTAMATKIVTVNEAPATISGVLTVCNSATTTLGTSVAGGTWTSDDITIASVSSAGVVTGVSPGVAAITYTTATSSATVNVTVTATLSITGIAVLCPGSTTTLSGGSAGGTWTGGSTVVATVGSTGIVTGIAAGATNITYSTGTACNATIQVTVNSAPASITGTLKACPGTSTTLSSMTAGGAWSTSDATIATADTTTGVITGASPGTVTVAYTNGAGCYRMATVTVNPTPAPIAGTLVICTGATTALTDVTPGLSWSSSNTAVATIASTGVATGVNAGNATITYTAASTNCIATAIVTVNGIPATIGGPSIGCVGSNIALTNSVPGGTWSSGNAATAIIDATTGLVTGVTSGMVTMTYTTGAGCYKTKQITINNIPGVTGYPTVCIGLTTTLSGGSSGTWSSSTPSVATITTSGGYVTGASAGTSTMTFTSTATTCPATYVVTVIPVPSPITGITTACQGAVITLSNSTPGGSWSSSNTAGATVGSATGIVTAVGSGGSVTISYSFGNNCRVTTSFALKPLPAIINGATAVCLPVTTTLSNTTPGGTWSSSNTSIATVGSGASTGYGLVTGVATGTANITYTITSTGCARSAMVTVDAGLDPGTITSSGGFTLHTLSAPTGVTLSSSGAAGGAWSGSNPAVATVNAATGLVIAVAAGSTTITYAVTTSCTNITTKVITVTAGRPALSQQSSVNGVQLYPNPTNGAFTLISEESGTLQLFSIDGRDITSYGINAGTNTLTLPSELEPGIYICRYTSCTGNTTMVRLVFEH